LQEASTTVKTGAARFQYFSCERQAYASLDWEAEAETKKQPSIICTPALDS
jgi:hypothetical protein